MSDAMLDTVEPEKKVAFMARPYSKDEKTKRDEAEIDELLQSQKQEAEEGNEEEPEKLNAEEATFKKRYSDLRRHQQKQAEELKVEIKQLKEQLNSSTKKQFNLPKSDSDITAWAEQYPDVAAIVESIAMKKAAERSRELEEKFSTLDEERSQVAKDKAETELSKYHEDIDSIRDSDDFHDWAEAQPDWIQKALYENDTDARAAARAIDLYKADMSTSSKQTTSKSKEKDAASAVKTRGERSRPADTNTAGSFKESVVEKMTPQEYEKNADAIMESIRGGSFIYDVSGSAR